MTLAWKSCLLFLLTLLTLLSGCGGSEGAVSAFGTGVVSPDIAGTGSIEVRTVLAREVPESITTFIFSGHDVSGGLAYGPVTLSKAPVSRLDLVPTSVVTLRILYLDGNVPRFLASVPVEVRVGEVTVVDDPDFVDFESTVSALEIAPSTVQLGVGQTASLVARGRLADNSTIELTSVVTWTSDAPGVARISNQAPDKGTVTAEAVGQAQIRAALEGLEAIAVVEVGAAVPVGLRISPPSGAVAVTGVGGALQLSADAILSDGRIAGVTNQAEWSLSDVDIASVGVNTGLVTGLQAGTVSVRAEFQGLTASIPLEVIQARLDSVIVSPGAALMHSGLAKQFRATGLYGDGSEVDLTFAADWSSSAETSVSVNENGLVRAGGDNGETATITASFQGVDGETTVRVGAFLYAASGSGGIVCQPLAEDGSFTGTQQTFQNGTTYQEVRVGPSGRNLFALTAAQTLQSFSLDPQDGSLTLVDTEACAISVAAASDPTSLVVRPDERFLYVTTRGASTIQGFGLDPETQAMTPLGASFSSATAIDTITFDRSGEVLLALQGNEMLRFEVDADSGVLQQLLPSTSATLVNPSFLQSASNGLIYAVNRGSRTLAVFSLDGAGTVRPIVGSQFLLPTAMNTSQLTRALILGDGSFMYGLINTAGLVRVPLSADTGRPFGNSSGPATPASIGLGLTQFQNGDFAYTQVDNATLGQTFRRIIKGVIGGDVPVSSPQSRSISVTP